MRTSFPRMWEPGLDPDFCAEEKGFPFCAIFPTPNCLEEALFAPLKDYACTDGLHGANGACSGPFHWGEMVQKEDISACSMHATIPIQTGLRAPGKWEIQGHT